MNRIFRASLRRISSADGQAVKETFLTHLSENSRSYGLITTIIALSMAIVNYLITLHIKPLLEQMVNLAKQLEITNKLIESQMEITNRRIESQIENPRKQNDDTRKELLQAIRQIEVRHFELCERLARVEGPKSSPHSKPSN